ncbi:site-2 protease family protein [Rapidithrix thailandica]|uniref:Site-2 protease family protein n=1 Tax=Rapidithrix thailandica TaxID=413964 RepID=A0AAW9SC05_9BACT
MLKKHIRQKGVHLLLFLITLVGTTYAGVEWTWGKYLLLTGVTWNEFTQGLYFSLPFLGILTCHEFGHYFTAKYYRLKVTLPYYIPFWFFGVMPSIGTMGAYIQIKSPLKSRKEFFDVGAAGPLAGFVVMLGVLYYAFTHLPEASYVFQIHPHYAKFGMEYEKYVYEGMREGENLRMGTNLLFELCKMYLVDDPSKIPNDHEIFHYPFLLASYLACFFTSLNLLPIGQLDGGHILYGLIGYRKHKFVSAFLFIGFIFLGGLGIFSIEDFQHDFQNNLWTGLIYLLFLVFVFDKITSNKRNVLLLALLVFLTQLLTKAIFPQVEGFYGWLVFGFLLGRVLGIYHPPALEDKPLDVKRKVIGWISLIVFILCFSPVPFIV